MVPTLRVLIADDDAIIRLDLRQTLEAQGYEVVAEAGDGAQLIEAAAEHSPDVCIVDVKMPVMDGIEAATTLMERNIAPVVLLTAYSDPELISRAKDAGVFGYLVKPFKPVDLSPAIEVARSRFEQNQALSAEVVSAQEKLDLRKLLDRTKGFMMKHYDISEPEAYRRLQQEAMNHRMSIKQVALAELEKLGVS